MKRLDLRLPDDLHASLKLLAERKNRSLHAQILWILKNAAAQSEEGKDS